jgi:uncharacterized C2H2 Zn-finger protein
MICTSLGKEKELLCQTCGECFSDEEQLIEHACKKHSYFRSKAWVVLTDLRGEKEFVIYDHKKLARDLQDRRRHRIKTV